MRGPSPPGRFHLSRDRPGLPSGRRLIGFANHFALVIEKRRDALGTHVDCHTGTQHEGFRIVYRDSIPADELEREQSKRHSPLKGLQDAIEVLACHSGSPISGWKLGDSILLVLMQ